MEEETPLAPLPDPKIGGDEAKQAPAYDDILREIGEFGAYQILAGLTVGFAFAFGSLVTMNFLFGADALEHRYSISITFMRNLSADHYECTNYEQKCQ